MVALPMMYGAILNHPLRSARPVRSQALHLWHGADGAARAGKAYRRNLPELRALLGTDRDVLDHDRNVQAGRAIATVWTLLGYFGLRQRDAIMDDAGSLLDNEEIGEIVHRGPNVMLGYYKDDEATRNAQAFGWHHPGDLGMFDSDGPIAVCRSQEGHDQVWRRECTVAEGGRSLAATRSRRLTRPPWVCRIPDGPEAVTAFVLLKPGADIGADDLSRRCRDHLGGYEVRRRSWSLRHFR